MKKSIQKLIGDNKLDQAFNAMRTLFDGDKYNYPAVLGLNARYSALKRKEFSGTMSFSDISVERSKIIEAMLSMVKDDNSDMGYTSTVSYNNKKNENMYPIDQLNEIIRTYNRKDSKVVESAEALLAKIRSYQDSKVKDSLFDVTQRRWNILLDEFNQFQSQLKENQTQEVEQKVEQISDLLNKDRIPTYDNLEKAYRLASGLGFVSEYCEKQLEYRTDDVDIRLNICDKIEIFVKQTFS